MRNSILFLLLTLLTAACSTKTGEAEFNVATYNIRQLNAGDSAAGDGWGNRHDVIASLINFHGFDIFGTQEGFKVQLEDLKKDLPGYEYIGVGRDDGKEAGEHSAIFYRTDLFDLLDHGDFWLSETPEKPGLGWDAACVRICTWGKFRHIPSGKDFMFFNLHMDHVGTVARVESAKLVKQKISEIGNGIPAFVTGDFNVDQTNPSYETFTGDGALRDSYESTDMRYALNGTFNSYHTDGFTTSRIDHIFTTPDVKVRKYGVLTDTYRTEEVSAEMEAKDAPKEIELKTYRARTPSDHFPVMIKVEI
ncbi:MAG: endonuclease/exonuclease/phosphatase family protein [Muribaculaceae bacterium]|nr:endonuclease/exonuclease/phosphatase family protein [Muribaculaceae bacterium]